MSKKEMLKELLNNTVECSAKRKSVEIKNIDVVFEIKKRDVAELIEEIETTSSTSCQELNDLIIERIHEALNIEENCIGYDFDLKTFGFKELSCGFVGLGVEVSNIKVIL